MKVKRLAVAAVALALAGAVAASGTALAGTVHGYPNATAYNEAVKLSHLKTVGTCAGYARSKFPDNEPSDVSSGHKLDGKSLSLRYYVIELDSSGAHIPAGKSEFELYDHAKDPLDAHDVAAAHPEEVARLAKTLEAWRRMVTAARLKPDAETNKTLSKEELERLKSLGYIQ